LVEKAWLRKRLGWLDNFGVNFARQSTVSEGGDPRSIFCDSPRDYLIAVLKKYFAAISRLELGGSPCRIALLFCFGRAVGARMFPKFPY
jgi:hypothetical protein